MADLHRRVSRRIEAFLTNSKSADRVAAEVIQMVAAARDSDTRPKDGDKGTLGSTSE